MDFPVGRRRHGLAATAVCALLAACTQPMDADLRGFGDGFNTTGAAQQTTAERPRPDNRGVISYPSYQVVVAQPGDSIEQVAGRVNLPAAEIASFNGLPAGITFRGGEVLVLPQRVAEPSPATGAVATGPIMPGTVDVTTIATAAIDRSSPTGATVAAPAATVQSGAEPTRHQVQRGETAFAIARLYNVTPKALADWNGLDANFTVREGQYLLIPVATGPAPAPAVAATTPPGTGSPTPAPPSASEPLPPPPPPREEAEEATPPSPEMSESRTAASSPGQMMMPVNGSIIRPYVEGSTDGIAIGAPTGTVVRAARNGTVAAISRDTNGVPIVVIRHEGNLLTIYSQVDDLTVKQGDSVSRGDPIGKVRAERPALPPFRGPAGLRERRSHALSPVACVICQDQAFFNYLDGVSVRNRFSGDGLMSRLFFGAIAGAMLLLAGCAGRFETSFAEPWTPPSVTAGPSADVRTVVPDRLRVSEDTCSSRTPTSSGTAIPRVTGAHRPRRSSPKACARAPRPSAGSAG